MKPTVDIIPRTFGFPHCLAAHQPAPYMRLISASTSVRPCQCSADRCSQRRTRVSDGIYHHVVPGPLHRTLLHIYNASIRLNWLCYNRSTKSQPCLILAPNTHLSPPVPPSPLATTRHQPESVSQLILALRSRLARVLASGRGADLHLVDTLLCLADAPDLLLLGATQPDVGPSRGAVPAVLAILVLQDHALPLAQALAIVPLLIVSIVHLDTPELAHARVAVALLGLLRGLTPPAQLVLVLAGLGGHAFVLHRTEDALWTVVSGQVILFLAQPVLLRRDFGRRGRVRIAGSPTPLGLAATGLVREYAVIDQPDAQRGHLGLEENPDRGREVGVQVIH